MIRFQPQSPEQYLNRYNQTMALARTLDETELDGMKGFVDNVIIHGPNKEIHAEFERNALRIQEDGEAERSGGYRHTTNFRKDGDKLFVSETIAGNCRGFGSDACTSFDLVVDTAKGTLAILNIESYLR